MPKRKQYALGKEVGMESGSGTAPGPSVCGLIRGSLGGGCDGGPVGNSQRREAPKAPGPADVELGGDKGRRRG